MSFLKKTKDIGIDFGTANTLIYLKGKGIVLKEPSVVAINNITNKIVAVGENARVMIGKTPSNIVTINPIKLGAVADFDITQDMMKYFIEKILSKGFGTNRIVACCPVGVTEVEKRAIEAVTSQFGTKDITLIEESMAAAIGSGLPVDEAVGNMIVVIGAGITDIAVISLDGIVRSKSLRVGGDKFDEAIINYIKDKHKLIIGKLTAEAIKIELGSVVEGNDKEKTMNVKGMDLVFGMPKAVNITVLEIREALKNLVNIIIESIKETLASTPPELAADIMNNGIMLAGGGALLYGFDKKITEETNITVNIAEEPLECVAIGIGKVLEYSSKEIKSTEELS